MVLAYLFLFEFVKNCYLCESVEDGIADADPLQSDLIVVIWPLLVVWDWVTKLLLPLQLMLLSSVEGCCVPWPRFDCICLSIPACKLLLNCCIVWPSEPCAFTLLKLWIDPKINEKDNKDKVNMKTLVLFWFNDDEIRLLHL